MTENTSDRVRLSLAVTQRVKQRLDDLLQKTEAETITEVLRRSLAVYEDLVETCLAGGRVILEDKSGHQREIQLTW